MRWTDIEGDYIKIQTQLLDEQTMNDDLSFNPRTYENVTHIKGNTDYGFRYMPLTDGAKKVLEHIKEINPNGEFILMNEGGQLTTVSFNRHLKTYCEAVGIEPRTSYKIRFTVASLLYKNGRSGNYPPTAFRTYHISYDASLSPLFNTRGRYF